MSLVAYGSSGESDSEDEEQQLAPSSAATVPSAGKVAENFLSGPQISSKDPAAADIHISDDEEDIVPSSNASFIDAYQEPDIMSLIARKLPKSKVEKITQKLENLVDRNEDVSTISKKVDYGTKIEEPPAKKKRGPAKISIPSLKELKDDEDDKPVPRVTVSASKTGSGLFSLLPQPKNTFTRRMNNVAKPETGEEEPVKRSPAVLMNGQQNNLKPSGVRRSGLVPHIIAQPKPKDPSEPTTVPKMAPLSLTAKVSAATAKATPADDSDSDGEDFMGINSGSYFPESAAAKVTPLVNPTPSSSSSLPSASSSTEHIYGLKRPPPPKLPVDPSYVAFDTPDAEDLGPAVAPYPPPNPSYAEPGPFIESQEAIERLAGKAAKRREFADMNIIDINEDEMRGDRNEWMMKALTEEQAPLPNRKNVVKGMEKHKHQITYLAHHAKERDFELRQEWSQARANKRASMNKYGFC